MEDKCIVCKTTKNVAPKIVGGENVTDSRFRNPILTLRTVLLCNDCYNKYKNKEIKIELK